MKKQKNFQKYKDMSTKKDLAEKELEQVQNEIKPKKTTAEKGVKYFEGKAKDGRAIKFPYRNAEQLKTRKKKFLN